MRIVDYATATHAGRVRRKNEDAYYAEPPLFAVADGMGGALAGELASRISVQTLGELVAEGSDEERLAATDPARQHARRRARDLRSRARPAWARPSRPRSSAAVRRGVRARRRLARLPLARRRADAPLRRPLAGRRVGQGGRARARGGRGAPAALRDHARARRRLAGRRRHLDDARARRRRLPALHRRPQRIRRRRGDRRDPARERRACDAAVHALVDAANATGGEDNITAVAFRLEADEGAPAEPADEVAADDGSDTGEVDDGSTPARSRSSRRRREQRRTPRPSRPRSPTPSSRRRPGPRRRAPCPSRCRRTARR